MRLTDAWKIFDDRSGRASDVNRQLAFAAIAIVWVFRGAEGSSLAIPDLLLWAGLFSAFALGADLLQYIMASLFWGAYARHKERKGVGTEERFMAPWALNLPAWILFVAKLLGVIASYCLIATFLVRAL